MRLSVVTSRVTLIAFCIAASIINQFSPEQIEKFLLLIPYRCPLLLITGWKCAFCGMTHSWIAMFRGDLETAFHENLFGPLLWFLTLVVLVLFSLNKKIEIKSKLSPIILAGIMVTYSVLRNWS